MRTIAFLTITALLLTAKPSQALTEAERSKSVAEVHRAIASAETSPNLSTPKVMDSVTGIQWLQMSADERADSLTLSMYILANRGVNLQRSPNDYYDAVNQKLRLDPNLYTAKLTNILASIVYEEEPENREALDRFRKPPKIQKIEMH